MADQKYRLITRADFDGVVTAVLLRELDLIDTIEFVHPKDMQDGKVTVTSHDITTNLPYVEAAYLCFDHHASEVARVGARPNLVIDPEAASAARVVFRHYGGETRFPDLPAQLMDAVDQADSAQYSPDDILAPEGWTQINFLMDPRTGLARFGHFAISNDELMRDMVIYCRHHSAQEILEIPDVAERLLIYDRHKESAEHQIMRCTTVHDKLAVIDLRGEDVIYACNRFLIYALFEQCDISMQVVPSDNPAMIEFAVGKSILDRGSPVDIGQLMLEFGGGGHRAAGTCRAPLDQADRVKAVLIDRITAR